MLGKNIQGVDQIEMPTGFPVGPVNTYLIDGEKLTLIDTGPNIPSNWPLFIKALEERSLTIYDIDQVVVTHHHLDHVGLLDRILEVHPIPVLGHPNNRPWLSQDPAFMEWHIEFFKTFLEEFGVPKELSHKGKNTVDNMKRLSCQTDLTTELNEGDTIPGLSEWKVIETLGHAQSHLCFYREKDRLMIGGDHIIKHISSNAQIEPPLNRNHNRVKPLIRYMDSLKKCAEITIETVLSGHGDVVENLPQLVAGRLDGVEKRASKIKEMIKDQYKSGFEIVQELFNPKTVRGQLNLTVSETAGHLDLLLDRDEIEEKRINGIKHYRGI